MELCQVAHQGALPLDAIPPDLHQETADRFVSQRLLAVILYYFFHLSESSCLYPIFPKKQSSPRYNHTIPLGEYLLRVDQMWRPGQHRPVMVAR